MLFLPGTSPPAFAQSVPAFPSSISFGNHALNQPSAAINVTFKNPEHRPLALQNLAISGDAANDYTVGGDCPASPSTIPAGTSCTISVTFTPSAAGLRSGKLSVTDDAHEAPYVITLSGTGVDSTQAVIAGGIASNPAAPHQPDTAIAGEKMAHRPVRPGATTGSGLLPGALNPLSSTGSAIGLISIVVTPANASIGAGGTVQFTATGIYSDGTSANLTSAVGWSSSSTGVSTINGAGLATGITAGSTVITASYASVASPPVARADAVSVGAPPIVVSGSSALSGSTTLTVTAPTLVSIAVTPANAAIAVGSTLQFTATGTYSNNTQQNLAGGVTWVSSSTSVAAINSAGLASSLTVGQTTITATSGGISGATGLIVTPGFTSGGNLTNMRQYHTATLLQNGQVLIVGGADADFDCLPYAELYDPTTGTSTATGNLATGRYSHTATLLNNGQVLIAGGIGANGFLKTAEIFNPATGTFAATGVMTTPRAFHTATLLPNGQVLLTGGYNGFVLGSAEVYDPATGTFTATGSLHVAREYHTATLLNDGTILISAGYDGDVALNSAEIFDFSTGTFTELSSTLHTARFFHTATLLNNGQVLLAGGQTSSPESETATAEIYDPFAQTFAATGSLTAARYYHTATLLNNAMVLVTGGCPSADGTYCNATPLASANLFNPATGVFSATGNLETPRAFQTATLLNNGQVLVTGGGYDGADDVTNSTELYGPANFTPSGLLSISLAPTNPAIPQGSALRFSAIGTFSGGNSEQLAEVTWSSSNPGVISISNDATDAGSAWAITGSSATITACAGMICGSTTATVGPPGPTSITGLSGSSTTGTLNTGRMLHTATLLNNGMVLIAGGVDGNGNTLASAELYNPATQTFTNTGSLITGRSQHTATLLPNGLVLIAGGMDANLNFLNSAELFNPATGSFTLTGSMANGRLQHTSTLLTNGLVLMVGGFSIDVGFIGPAELYNPVTGTFTVTGTMNNPRDEHTATLLNDGTVLIAGGWNDNAIAGGEIYNPSTGAFVNTTGSLNTARYSHTATLLNNGLVLLAGGAIDVSDDPTGAAELYNPVSGNFTTTGSMFTARYNHTATLLTSGLVLMAGGADDEGGDPTAATELYDPASATFTPGSSLVNARTFHTATLLNNSQVLLVGGYGTEGVVLGSSEIYIAGLITPPNLSTITIAPASPTIPQGSTLQFSAVGTLTGGATEQLAAVAWTSSNPSVISISGAGVAYAAATGSATITGCAGLICASTTASVGPVIVGITVVPSNATIAPAGTLQYAASGTLADGSTRDVTAYVTWNSSVPGVATIGTAGLATGVNSGATTITATSGSVQASTTLTVTGFALTGGLNTARTAHTATLLNNGMVLIAGGADTNGDMLTSAELYNPATGAFIPTGSLNVGRYSHTATLLNNGMVLIAGGATYQNERGEGEPGASVELYNPATGTFTVTSSMIEPRYGHTATLLPSGLVLIAGGQSPNQASAELYNPATGTFTLTGTMTTQRVLHSATLLNSGMVLMAGGLGANGPNTTAELYNPATGTFTATGNMLTGRYYQTATLLNNGMVLVAGGSNPPNSPITDAEIYDPDTGIFTATGNLNDARYAHSATLLNNGQVLMEGGRGANGVLQSAELYNPASGAFAYTTALNTARSGATGTLLINGAVLIAGGIDNNGNSLSGAELYNPATFNPPSLVSVAINPSAPAVPQGSGLRFTAVGTFPGGLTEELAEVTWVSSNPGTVAISNDSSNSGEAIGLTRGPATIRACAGNLCGATNVTVVAPVTSLVITPANPTAALGSTEQFSATALLGDGSTQNATSEVAWSSSAPGVAILNESGLATTVSAGITTITATWGGVQTSTNLTVSGGFELSGNLTRPTTGQTATLLDNGQVLVAGGLDSAGDLIDLSELYDPTAGTFTPAGNVSFPIGRAWHTATLLNNGLVLIAGGVGSTNPQNGAYVPLATAQLYNPVTGTFTYTGSLNTARAQHTATLLPNGMVLMAGGCVTYSSPSFCATATNSAELYDPASGAFVTTGNLVFRRIYHTATLLSNGLVLIVGGSQTGFWTDVLSNAELYNPATGTFTEGALLQYGRLNNTATLLNNGMVLIAGGIGQLSGTTYGPLAKAELYNPAPGDAGNFVSTGSLAEALSGPSATLLSNGQVLIAGGCTTPNQDNGCMGVTSAAELYNPQSGVFSSTGSLTTPRTGDTATLMSNGSVLLVGGVYDSSGDVATSSELYEPSTQTPSNLVSIAVSPDSLAMLPGAAQNFKATGTLTGGNTEELASVIWTSSDPLVASVSNDSSNSGEVGAVAPGVATISACAGSVCGSAQVTVNPPPISITVTAADSTVAVGSTLQFSAVATLSNGTIQDVSSAASWNSSAFSLASINGSGLASGVSNGITIITATLGGVQGSTPLIVGPALSSIVVSPPLGQVGPFQTLQYSAQGVFSDGSDRIITSLVTWSSSNLNIATINPAGLASGVDLGSTTITATFGNMQGSEPLLVVNGTVAQTGGMSTPRLRATATLLDNGGVLMAGGLNSDGAVDTAEIYNPSLGSFNCCSTLNQARYAHTATLLNNGDVLVAGGFDSGYSLGTAETYDPNIGPNGAFGYTYTNLIVGRYGHTATLLPSGMVLLAGGIDPNGFPTSAAEIYDPYTEVFSSVGNMRTARAWHTATLLNNGLVLFAGGQNSNGVVDSAELYDPNTNAFLVTGGLEYARYLHTATLLGNGQVLLAGGQGNNGYLASAELYDPVTGNFTPTGNLNTAREQHAATLLSNGMVLIAGGENTSGFLASEELYNPFAETFTLTGNLITQLGAPTATMLGDGTGNILIAGGYNSGGFYSTAQLFQPGFPTPSGLESITINPSSYTLAYSETQQFTAVGRFHDGSTQQLQGITWSSSNSNEVQVGDDVTNPGAAQAIINPPSNVNVTITAKAGTISGTATVTVRPIGPVATGNLHLGRYFHTATLLNNGQVLIAGGCTGPSEFNCTPYVGSGELYNPATGAFTGVSSINYTRIGHTATLLSNGEVLIAGGTNNSGLVANAEIFNPNTNTFTVVGSLQTPREYATATLLNNGEVLIAGGTGCTGFNCTPVSQSTAELYNPSSGTFTATGSMSYARQNHTATLLNNGMVFVAGGADTPTILDTTELYNPATGTFISGPNMNYGRQQHTATLLLGGTVLLVGGASCGTSFCETPPVATAEIYDPVAQIITTVGNLNYPRQQQTATLLNYNGYVLIAGGNTVNGVTNTLEWYTPSDQSFAYLSSISLNPGLIFDTATMLNNGMVLFAGGQDPNGNVLSNASVY